MQLLNFAASTLAKLFECMAWRLTRNARPSLLRLADHGDQPQRPGRRRFGTARGQRAGHAQERRTRQDARRPGPHWQHGRHGGAGGGRGKACDDQPVPRWHLERPEHGSFPAVGARGMCQYLCSFISIVYLSDCLCLCLCVTLHNAPALTSPLA